MEAESSRIEDLLADLDHWAMTLAADFDAFIEQYNLYRLLEEEHISVSGSVESFRQAIGQIRENWAADAARPALAASTALLAMDAQLGLFNAAFKGRFKKIRQGAKKVKTAVQKAWKSLKKKLGSLLNVLQSGLKSLLSRLPHLKEWSISGDSGVHAFGLKSTLTLELTFNRQPPSSSGSSGHTP